MSYRLSDVVYETRSFFVLRCDKGHEVYRRGSVAATRVAFDGLGLAHAKAEADRRQAADDAEFDKRAKARVK